MRKVLAYIAAATLLSACVPSDINSQLDSLCSGIRGAQTVLAGENLPSKVQEALDGAQVVCTTKPKDAASAVVTLAALYLVVSKYQNRVK